MNEFWTVTVKPPFLKFEKKNLNIMERFLLSLKIPTFLMCLFLDKAVIKCPIYE